MKLLILSLTLAASFLTTNIYSNTCEGDSCSSHPGAIHQIKGLSSEGEVIELEDGSLWGVSSGDRSIAQTWSKDDPVTLINGKNETNNVPLALLNLKNNQEVWVSQVLESQGDNALRAVSVDRLNYKLILSDGSKWSFSPRYPIYPGFPVMIGKSKTENYSNILTLYPDRYVEANWDTN